jgi:MarR family transcriptional regulator, organic hydroperoxide resistance regulator
MLLALQRATHATLDAIDAELADLAIGAAEANVLATLADGSPRTPSELAAQVGSRTTTMTSVLDRLEQRRFIRRGPHPTDRRAIQIELTAAGRRAATTTRAAFRRAEARALAGLPASTVAALRTALDRMAAVRHD